MKSPALAAAMKPLDLIEKGEHSRFEETCKQMQAAQKSRRSEIEAIRQALKVDMRSDFLDDLQSKQQRLESLEVQDASSKELPEKRYKTNDPTVEKLALILKDNPHGILLLRDELNGWLDSLTRSGREGSKEFYLETWNGLGSFSVDRIGRGSVHVDALCLSIFGGIQPSKLNSYIDRTASASGDDGFLERFQIVFYPERPGEFQLIDRAPDTEAFNAAFEAISYLDRLSGSVTEGSYIRFSANAQAAADGWRVHLETRILKEKLSPIFRSHLSKYRSLMPSLALIFEMLSQAARNDPPKQVGEVATSLAIRWCQVLESHIRKVYKNSIHDPFFSTRALAQRILTFDVCDGDKVRDIGRKKWKGLTNTESLQTALAELTARSWIRVQRISSQGGPSEVIRINPNLSVGTGKGGSHV